MKKIGYIIGGIWCVFTSFISPIWLTMVFLYITGLIYKYDCFIDEGVAGIMGVIGLMLWIFIVLMPDIIFLQHIKSSKYHRGVIAAGIIILPAVLCVAMCRWDMVRFLTMPGGKLF